MRRIVRNLLMVLAMCALESAASAQPAADLAAGVSGLGATGGGSTLPEFPPAMSIQDMVRIRGQGSTPLRGIGIVVGLRGTGDSGQELALARPLAEVHRNNGNPLPDLAELAKAKSAALVWLSCEVPETGARTDDRFDVTVSVMHSASSLLGGELIIAPLSGPLPGQGVFAMAAGPVTVENTAVPTVGRIRGGARMIRDIPMPRIEDELTLVIDPQFRGWTTARTIAGEINGAAVRLDDQTPAPPIARVIDDTTVAVAIPPEERGEPANFIARILSTRLSPSLVDLPAQVIINERTGAITCTADVEISPVAISYKDLVVTTTTPVPGMAPPPGTLQSRSWFPLQTAGRASERARLADLIHAFDQLDIPAADRINIITQIHASGRLHAKLIVQ